MKNQEIRFYFILNKNKNTDTPDLLISRLLKHQVGVVKIYIVYSRTYLNTISSFKFISHGRNSLPISVYTQYSLFWFLWYAPLLLLRNTVKNYDFIKKVTILKKILRIVLIKCYDTYKLNKSEVYITNFKGMCIVNFAYYTNEQKAA